MRVRGSVRPPGDKSITHRALILGALASGTSEIDGALNSLDARSTARVLRQMGVAVSPLRPGARVAITGRGIAGALVRPRGSLNCGNSGTAARLVLGLLAGSRFAARVTGDASLRRRPMRRVTVPLTAMGGRFDEPARDGLPITVHGGRLRSLEYVLPTASAQVKGALLLAGLVGGVSITLREPARSRDHTERMLRALGVQVTNEALTIRLDPPARLPAFRGQVPADPSSAAFLAAAALLADAGELVLEGVSINPTRIGFLKVLERMGAHVAIHPRDENLGEPTGDLLVHPSRLHGTVVEAAEVPSLIDEIPILAVLASRADGQTEFRGVEELRVKESDRLALLAANLRGIGVEAEATANTLRLVGTQGPPRGRVETAGDHRLAMAFAVLGRLDGAAIKLSESRSPAVSYPGFFADLGRILGR